MNENENRYPELEPVGGETVSENTPVAENNADREEFISEIVDETETGNENFSESQTYARDTGADWREPAYEAAGMREEAYSPSFRAQSVDTSPPTPPKKPKKRHGFLKAVCIVLACVIFSSTACYFVADYVVSRELENSPKNVIIGSQAENKQTNNGNGSGGTSVSYTGEVLSGDQIYELACKQTVGVNTSINTTNIFGQTTSSAVAGSGFIISEDGYILTNYHVISYAVLYNGELTVMFYDGTSCEAKVVGYDESNDVAIIKADMTGLTPVTFGDSDSIKVGETVYAVGNPLGELAFTMTTGSVSALDREITTADSTTGTNVTMNMFQIDAAVNSGNSGGPVYNSRGEVIGVVTAKYSSSGVEGIGFAIPINDAMNIAQQLIEKGYVATARLGVSVVTVSEAYSSFIIQYYDLPEGAYIVSVEEGSAAANAGLRAGDIVTTIGDKTITSQAELQLAVKSHSPGDTTTLKVYRMGSTLGSSELIELTVTFDESQPQVESSQNTQNSNQSSGQGGYPGYYYRGR